MCVLFDCLISRTFSTNKQCFSLTTNQRTVLSAMTFQPNEQERERYIIINNDEGVLVYQYNNQKIKSLSFFQKLSNKSIFLPICYLHQNCIVESYTR
jgi:hypothetical protein